MDLDANLSEKYQALREYLLSAGRFIIAYSGGVDSTTLLGAAVVEKGVEVKAVLVLSALTAEDEGAAAEKFLKEHNIPHRLLHLDLLAHENVRANPPDRCYHCKKQIFTAIENIAREESFPLILEGSNADDLHDYRPGRIALEELGIKSPLLELGFSKMEIRTLARHLDLPVWDRPSSPCLATRIPTGIHLREGDLRAIEGAEKALKSIGLKDLRVRLHGDMVRLEVPPGDLDFCTAVENRDRIIKALRKTGAKYLSLDLEGYRTGSMNTVTTTPED